MSDPMTLTIFPRGGWSLCVDATSPGVPDELRPSIEAMETCARWMTEAGVNDRPFLVTPAMTLLD